MLKEPLQDTSTTFSGITACFAGMFMLLGHSPLAKAWPDKAVGQNQWYHFVVGAPPILVYFSEDWDIHWGHDLGFDP